MYVKVSQNAQISRYTCCYFLSSDGHKYWLLLTCQEALNLTSSIKIDAISKPRSYTNYVPILYIWKWISCLDIDISFECLVLTKDPLSPDVKLWEGLIEFFCPFNTNTTLSLCQIFTLTINLILKVKRAIRHNLTRVWIIVEQTHTQTHARTHTHAHVIKHEHMGERVSRLSCSLLLLEMSVRG